MRTRGVALLVVFLAGCSAGVTATTVGAPPTTVAVTQAPPITAVAPPPTTAAAATPTTSPPLTSTTQPPDTTLATPWTPVTTPGTFDAADLEIHIRFESEVADVGSADLASIAQAILNDTDGWQGSGFIFVADQTSELVLILAEGSRVDALCLPLKTYGKVSCQNGPVVALNADRWRQAGDDWDGTVESYRTYLVNHEVGHLIGLRHPQERCPTQTKVSALMEPQTNNLQDCIGNGVPLDWELMWARRRPATIGPDPSWDGPRPSWPTGS